MMKKILYTKYNSLRRPQFQMKTSIVEQDGKKYVLKSPMCEKAVTEMQRLQDNYQTAVRIYRSIQVLPYNRVQEGLLSDYLEGNTLLDEIDFSDKDIRDIIGQIEDRLEETSDFHPASIKKKFEMSAGFSQMFPGCNPGSEEISVEPVNLDGLLDNFIRTRDGVWCIDYEWVFGFAVPVRYLKYRTLLYLYSGQSADIRSMFGLEEFFHAFGYRAKEIQLYNRMEECFQQYVHGRDRKYIYTNHYEKRSTCLDDLQKQIVLKEDHIRNLESSLLEKDRVVKEYAQQIIDIKALARKQKGYIDDIHLAMRDPAFAARLIKNKLKGTITKKITSGDDAGAASDKEDMQALQMEPEYEMWMEHLENTGKYEQVFSYNPKISVIVPVYNVLDRHLVPCIESVQNQIYENWELCLADDHSTWENVRRTLETYRGQEKIKVVFRERNGHISACTNTALEQASGEFIAFLDCDDLLSPNALYEVVRKLNEDPNLDYIYSDEDKVDEDGRHRHMPFFKPDWSPDTLMSTMYTCHLGVYRRSIAKEIGGLRIGYEGAQDYDFALRFTEKTNRIAHISKVLYHWRERAESTSAHPEAKPYTLEATRKSKKDALKRRGLKARLKEDVYQLCVDYIPQGQPLVSIIIPSKDNYKLLQQCVESLAGRTAYKAYEIILVDNGSSRKNREDYARLAEKYQIRYVYQKMEFNFPKMCRLGVEHASGSYYLFLNDDVEAIHPEWLGSMLGQAQQAHTGAVGAKLLYPGDHAIQHAGIINIENGPVHCFQGLNGADSYYFGRTVLTYNVLAVTGACLMVDALKYHEIGGFNEDLPVAYNDVDLCFKLYEAGYYNVIRNDIVLYHHESVSRGNDSGDPKKMKRLAHERELLYGLHRALDCKDPFYNRMLAQNRADFSYNYELDSNAL